MQIQTRPQAAMNINPMKKILVIALLLFTFAAGAQDNQNWKRQARFGWSGYPVTESVIHTWHGCDCGDRITYLHQIYRDYELAMYTTGGISGEIAWLYKDWFTFALTMQTNFTWQGMADAVSSERSGTDTSLFVYLVPQARFNWVRRDLVKMYTSIGLGAMAGYDLSMEPGIIPVFELTPVGIEVGRKVFGFCEFGIGMLYTGAMAGVGFRF